eukprot:1056036-Prorocentrum_minimum.AAC.2
MASASPLVPSATLVGTSSSATARSACSAGGGAGGGGCWLNMFTITASSDGWAPSCMAAITATASVALILEASRSTATISSSPASSGGFSNGGGELRMTETACAFAASSESTSVRSELTNLASSASTIGVGAVALASAVPRIACTASLSRSVFAATLTARTSSLSTAVSLPVTASTCSVVTLAFSRKKSTGVCRFSGAASVNGLSSDPSSFVVSVTWSASRSRGVPAGGVNSRASPASRNSMFWSPPPLPDTSPTRSRFAAASACPVVDPAAASSSPTAGEKAITCPVTVPAFSISASAVCCPASSMRVRNLFTSF